MKSCTRFAAVGGLLMVGLMLSLLSSGCETQAFSTTSSATSKPGGGGAWVLVGDNRVYISGDQPYICTDTVCAGAGGSAMYAYNFDTAFGFDPQVRFVLIESASAGSVTIQGASHPQPHPFLADRPSYIDVHLNSNAIEQPQAWDFAPGELDHFNPPAHFPSDGLWHRLRGLQAEMKKHGKDLPQPHVGPHP